MTTDWVTPAWGSLRGGEEVHVISSPFTGAQMQRELRTRGIDTWAWQPLRGGATFRVGASQARFAKSMLQRMGVVCV